MELLDRSGHVAAVRFAPLLDVIMTRAHEYKDSGSQGRTFLSSLSSYQDTIRRQNHFQLPTMPVHPSEENAADNLTDKVAQHSKDSGASDHPLHDENKGPFEQAKSTRTSGGPQVPDSKLSSVPPTTPNTNIFQKCPQQKAQKTS